MVDSRTSTLRRGCDECACVEYAPAAPSAPLREATEAENDLIVGLARDVGLRLLRAWEDLPSERRALTMNRAFLSALSLAIGQFLGAVAVNEPENLEGWTLLVERTLEIIRQTAADKRAAALEAPTEGTRAARGRVLMPEPKGVM